MSTSSTDPEEQLLELLDPPLGDVLRELSRQLGASPALALPILLGTASAATQLVADVSLNGGIMPANVSTNVIAERGQGKSSSFRLLTPPIKNHEDEGLKSASLYNQKCRDASSIRDAQVNGLLRKITKYADDHARVERLTNELNELRAIPQVFEDFRGYVYDDLSLTSLRDHFSGENKSAALITDEAGKLYEGPLLGELVNQLSDGSDVTAKNSRSRTAIINPRFVMVTACPPGPYFAAIKAQPNLVTGGFTARILQTMPAPRIKETLPNLTPGPHLRQHNQRISKLLKQSLESKKRMLSLNFEAMLFCQQKIREVSVLSRPGQLLHRCPAFASRFIEHVVRLAAVIHVIMFDNDEINERTIVQAYDLVRFFAREHIRIFFPEETNGYAAQAVQDLIDYCRERLSEGLLEFPFNDVLKFGPEPRKAARYKPAMAELTAMGWAKIALHWESKRPTKYVLMNPVALAQQIVTDSRELPIAAGFTSWSTPTRLTIPNDTI